MIFDVLVARYLRRNGLRSFVTAAAVALAVAIAVAVDTVNASASASFASGVRIAADVVNLQVFGQHQRLDDRLIAVIRANPGVDRVDPVIERQMNVRASDGRLETLNVVGVDLLQQLPRDAETRDVRPGSLDLQGSDPAFDRLIVDGEAIVSARVAAAYRLRSNSLLAGRIGGSSVALRIASVLPPTVADIDSSVVLIDIGEAKKLSGTGTMVDRIDCVVDPLLLGSVKDRIAKLLPPGGRVVIPQHDDRLASISQTFQRALIALSMMAFVVSGLLIYDGIATSAAQRQAEIVTLRNLGAQRAVIFRAFLLEGVLIGIVGAVEGLALSAFLIWALVTGGVTFDVRAMFAAAIAGVGIATVSALLPAIRAANGKAPASALPRRMAEKKTDLLLLSVGIAIGCFGFVLSRLGLGGAWWDPSLLGAFAFVAAALLCVPAVLRAIATFASRQASPALPSVRFATAHLAATPRATAVIVAALVAAIAMLVTASVVVASYRAAVVTWAATTLPADLVVRPNDGLADGGDVHFTEHDLQRMRATPGVAGVRDLDAASQLGQDSVAITAGDGVDLIALRAHLIQAVSPTLVRVTATRELRSQIVSIFERTFTIAFGLCIVALFVAIAGMANALAASVLERTLEIGLLRYLGLRRAAVELMIVVEAGVIGVVACAAGVALGSIVSSTIVAGARLGGETPIGTIFPLGQMWPIAGFALFAILVAGIHPGHVASRIRTERVLTVD